MCEEGGVLPWFCCSHLSVVLPQAFEQTNLCGEEVDVGEVVDHLLALPEAPEVNMLLALDPL